MNREELNLFLPDLLEARYPGLPRKMGEHDGPGLPGVEGWMLNFNDFLLVVRVSQSTHPFIWIRSGLAHGLPKSETLALRIAAGNKDLVVGRLYMAFGDDLAMVAFEETVFGGYLSFQHKPSIHDVVNKVETSVDHSKEWSKTIREEFGGQQFAIDDCHLLTF